MVRVIIPYRNVKITNSEKAGEYLKGIGVIYERWGTRVIDPENSGSDQILESYKEEIEQLKKEGGYTTADVIDINEKTPGLEAMLEKFRAEHTHNEDEVRFTISGRGIFHIHPEGGDVVAIEVEEGDLIRVPRGTKHWFDLCEDRHIRAIRLFQDISGWTPYYTNSGKDRNYEPICLGPSYIKPGNVRK
ncbi:MAG: cupin domain-containing protein [Candidatus Thermoplasmatota archaeon]|nr:cupin domain-containing protein [Candidatus Thermoplasmatota archaeon]